MAHVVPIVATIGGGSAALGAVILGGTVASGLLAANQQRRAGKIAAAEKEIQAKAEGDASRQREIDRKKALLRSISARLAESGAAGVSFSEGSPQQMTQLDIAEMQDDLQVDRANTKQKQATLRSQGRAAKIQGRTAATVSLIDTATKVGGLI